MPISTSDTKPSSRDKAAIRARARELGFDAVGFAPARLGPEREASLNRFLSEGRHGDMDWLARRADERANPQRLWPAVRSVIVVAANYGPEDDPRAALADREAAAIASYAQGDDYHDLLKKRLKALARWIAASFEAEVKVFVDTAPVMEKPLAAAAGIGWQGKHTNLVSRAFGSWLFLGEVFTELEFAPDDAHEDRCGTCRACLDACPTDAFPAPYRLDARRCISYLTIEHKGHIPREFRTAMGNRIFGCDDCLAVCPWNRFAAKAREAGLWAREALRRPRLADLAALDDAAFRALFRKSPVKRTGRDRFVRNVLIAIGNSGAPDLVPAARARLDDASPLVRAMAVWALGRLLDPDAVDKLRRAHAPRESDPAVHEEWRLGGLE